MNRSLLATAVVVLLAISTVACHRRARIVVPEPDAEFPVPPGCAHYAGRLSGNDPDMKVDLSLCPLPAGLGGWIQYESRISGWSLREVIGATQSDGTLRMRDLRIVEDHPSEEWRYCLVDEYVLRQVSADAVEGSYVSSACSDNARLVLYRVH